MSKLIKTVWLSDLIDLIDEPETNRIVCHDKEFVRVVRCKDCFHYWKGNGVCDAHIDLIDVDDNCYCSWGERREDGKAD